MLQLIWISLGICAVNALHLHISLSQFQCLSRSSFSYLSWSRTSSSVCCLYFISQTPSGLTQTLTCSSFVQCSPRCRFPRARAYTLAIYFHLCIRLGLSVASLWKGRLLVAWVNGALMGQLRTRQLQWRIQVVYILDNQNSPAFSSSLMSTFIPPCHFIQIPFKMSEQLLEI